LVLADKMMSAQLPLTMCSGTHYYDPEAMCSHVTTMS